MRAGALDAGILPPNIIINHQYTSGQRNRQSRAIGRQRTVIRFLAPELALIPADGLLLGRVVNLKPMVLRLKQAEN
jgi:hypothetical protein